MIKKLSFIILIIAICLIGLIVPVSAVNTTYYYAQTGNIVTPAYTVSQGIAWCANEGGTGNGFSQVVSFYDDHYGAVATSSNNECWPSACPVYTFPTATYKSVSLTTSCTKGPPFVANWTTANWPTMNFTAEPLTGTAPLTVNFTIQNSSPSYNWYWGDGGETLDVGNVPISHVYSLPGSYSVTLANASGLYSLTKSSYIQVTSTNASPFSITALPSNINYGSTSLGTIVGANLSRITSIRWYVNYPGQALTDFYESNNHDTLNYAKIGSNWMGWDANTNSFSNNKGTSFPNPVTLIPHYGGNLSIGCYIYLDDGSLFNPTTYLIVGQAQGLNNITFHAEDALSGSHLSPSTFNIRNLITNSWTNSSEIRPGQVDVQYPFGTNLFIEVIPPTGSGYSVATDTYSVLNYPGAQQQHVISLWRNASVVLTNTTANLAVRKNSDFSAINGATISLSDGQSCITSGNGACQFTLLNGTLNYRADVSATGFVGNTFYFIPSGSSYSRAFMLVQIGETPTPIITVPTSPGTPSPTQTYVGQTTIPTPYPTGNGTFWETPKATLRFMGADDSTMGIVLAGLVIFACATLGALPGLVMGSSTATISPIGAEIGAICGILLSMAFGFFPMFVVVAGICGLILYVSLRIYGR